MGGFAAAAERTGGGAADLVVLGLSGGVDSAVAALLLLRAGFRVHAVTFRLWTDPSVGQEKGRHPAGDLTAARRVAQQLHIPHSEIDLSARFIRDVVEPFVATYAKGWTPNPCAECNVSVRFPALLAVADRLRAAHAATGHYARMAGHPPHLCKARSPARDQSYFLARVRPDLLARFLFPLGDLDKAEVRKLARKADLAACDRPESQEICFIPDNNYERFLAGRFKPRPGPVLDQNGTLLGSHTGIHRFTVGQRRGLGIAAGSPLYVIDIRSADNAVVVGPREALAVHRLVVCGLTWHDAALPSSGLTVQIRSNGRPVPAVALHAGPDRIELDLQGQEKAAAPGQTAVVYADGRVVCAGTIVPAQTA